MKSLLIKTRAPNMNQYLTKVKYNHAKVSKSPIFNKWK